MVIELPIPPSTNHLFVTVGRRKRVASPQYEAWRFPVVLLLRQKRLRVQRYPVRIRLDIHGGADFNESRDLDNCLKAPIDALVLGGVLKADDCRHVRGIAIEYLPGLSAHPKGIVRIEIIEPDIDTRIGPDTIKSRPTTQEGKPCRKPPRRKPSSPPSPTSPSTG